MVPPTGARLMWTSNTDMKIDTRTSGSASSASSPTSSRGGATVSISVTSPSAGATISPSPCGTARTGSRKKAAIHSVTAAIGHASVSHAISAKTNVSTAAMPRNL